MKKDVDKILLYLALILIIGLGFLYFNLRQENSKLSKFITDQFEQEREVRDSIFEVYCLDIERINETNETLSLEIKELDKSKGDIKKKHDEDKTNVDRITSADSLERFFTRRYQR